MNIILKVKKIGNHWYPCIKHEMLDDISLNEKLERVLSYIDKENTEELQFIIYEISSWTNNETVQFHDEDMWKWINTTDVFDMRFYINDHEYKISSTIIDLLEDQYKMCFYETLYSIELCSM